MNRNQYHMVSYSRIERPSEGSYCLQWVCPVCKAELVIGVISSSSSRIKNLKNALDVFRD